ncbi:dymeclin-like [Crassostrea virginica]
MSQWVIRGPQGSFREPHLNIFTWQTRNALFIIRSLSKYFNEHLSEELILQQFEAKPKDMGCKERSHDQEYTGKNLHA